MGFEDQIRQDTNRLPWTALLTKPLGRWLHGILKAWWKRRRRFP